MKVLIASQDFETKDFNLTQSGSDFSSNQMILNSLIGTLVKYGPSGRIEPYLATSWEVSADKKTWRFKIRENLTAEDGTSLSAKKFHEILLENFKNYSRNGQVMEFKNLKGWDQYISNKKDDLEGLKFDDHHLIFQFDTRPDDILELLQMSYFGLWMNDSNNKIISTAAYKLKSQKKGEVELSLRDGWFSANKDSFKEISIAFIGTDISKIELDPYTLIEMPYNSKTINVKDAYWITNTPTVIDTFVLSPFKKNFFNDINNRKTFQRRIRELPKNKITSDFFYPSAPSNIAQDEMRNYKENKSKELLTFALERTNYTEEEIHNFHEIITYALNGSGNTFKILKKDNSDPDWYKKTDSNEYFDARISSVDIGAHPLFTAIKMMFCTKLGVTFPDLDNKICDLVDEYQNREIELDQKFIDRFNKTITDQAIIIPITHHSKKWLVSKKINPLSLPATSPHPLFEMIKYEE